MQHNPSFFQMRTELESMSDGHLGHINVSKHLIHLINNGARPVHCVQYQACPKVRQLAPEKISGKLSKNVTEVTATDWVAPIVLYFRKDASAWFWVDSHKLMPLRFMPRPYSFAWMNKSIVLKRRQCSPHWTVIEST